MRLAARYQATYLEDPTKARPVLGELLASVGEGVDVRPPLSVDYGSNVSIGARTFVNCNLTALDVARISIGEDCQIGPNVQLLTPTHPVEPHSPGGTSWKPPAPSPSATTSGSAAVSSCARG